MLKKLFLVLFVLVNTFVYSQSIKVDVIVDSIVGKVTMETTPGKWVAIKVGDILKLETLINVGLNSKLILKIGEKKITVSAMTKKTISTIISSISTIGITAPAATKNSGISASDVTTSTNVPTASTRASDATGDVSWEDD
jgi:hypothetical protein